MNYEQENCGHFARGHHAGYAWIRSHGRLLSQCLQRRRWHRTRSPKRRTRAWRNTVFRRVRRIVTKSIMPSMRCQIRWNTPKRFQKRAWRLLARKATRGRLQRFTWKLQLRIELGLEKHSAAALCFFCRRGVRRIKAPITIRYVPEKSKGWGGHLRPPLSTGVWFVPSVWHKAAIRLSTSHPGPSSGRSFLSLSATCCAFAGWSIADVTHRASTGGAMAASLISSRLALHGVVINRADRG